MKRVPKYNLTEVTPAEGIQIQKELRHLVSRRWDGRTVKLVAGADVHFPSKKTVRAAFTLFTYPGLGFVASSIYEGPCSFPYVPGLLSFRELPPLLGAWKQLTRYPDLILCDGQGIAHPRGCGLASHLGIELNLPTIGCAKSPLFGDFNMPGPFKGDHSPIRDKNGMTIGAVLRTRDRTKPLYVSTGHRINLRTALRIVLACTPRYRIPEPLRLAHRLAGGNRSSPDSRG